MVNDFPKDIAKVSGTEDTKLHSPIPNTVFVLGRVSIAPRDTMTTSILIKETFNLGGLQSQRFISLSS